MEYAKATVTPGDPSDVPPELLQKMQAAYAARTRYWSHYMWPARDTVNKYLTGEPSILQANSKGRSSTGKLRNLILEGLDKLNASFYHLVKLRENEELPIKIGGDFAAAAGPLNPGWHGMVGLPYEPVGYEYEAIVVQSKAAFDLCGSAIAYYLDLNFRDVKGLRPALEQSKHPKAHALSAQFKSEKYTRLYDELNDKDGEHSKRNWLEHYGTLPVGEVHINYYGKDQAVNKAVVRPHGKTGPPTPTMPPNYQSVDDYCTDLFYLVCDFVLDVYAILFDLGIRAGERESVLNHQLKTAKAGGP